MKNKGILSALVSFVVLFLGTGFIIGGAVNHNFVMMIVGLTFLFLACLAYFILLFLGIMWLRRKDVK